MSEPKEKETYGSRQIRVSDAVFLHIQKLVKRPLLDTADSILREIFGLPKKAK